MRVQKLYKDEAQVLIVDKMNFNATEKKLLDNIEGIFGEVYKITNSLSGKSYVGQVRSHRLNHSRYRPFGSQGRFKDHISEAMCNSKKCQCSYLNSSIRKNGAEHFSVETLERCCIENIDECERKWISALNTLYPNGYNLTRGGKTLESIGYVSEGPERTYDKKGRRTHQTKETKEKISQRLKEAFNDPSMRKAQSQRTTEQHFKSKLKRFESVQVDRNKIDTYLHTCNGSRYSGYRVIIDGKRADFMIPTNTSSELNLQSTKARAIMFINELIMYQERGKN